MSQDPLQTTSNSSNSPNFGNGKSVQIPSGIISRFTPPIGRQNFSPTPSQRRDSIAKFTLLGLGILFVLSLFSVITITLWGSCEDITKRFEVVFPIFEKTTQLLMPIALLVIGFYFSNKNGNNDDKSES